MSGKIITRVRERERAVQAKQILELTQEMRRQFDHSQDEYWRTCALAPRDPPIGRIYKAETPGAYASDPISRFFRWVFRL